MPPRLFHPTFPPPPPPPPPLPPSYAKALACFATASSSTLRGLSIGFDLASLISRHIDHAFVAMAQHIHRLEVLKVLPAETKKLLGLTVSLVSLLKGLLVVHYIVPKMTVAISSSALGALFLTDTIVAVTDKQAGGPGKGWLHDKMVYLASNVLLTLAGCVFQTHRAGEEMPRVFEILLYPAVRMERFLRSLDGILGSSRDKIQAIVLGKKGPGGTPGAAAAAAVAGAEPLPPPAARRREGGPGGLGGLVWRWWPFGRQAAARRRQRQRAA